MAPVAIPRPRQSILMPCAKQPAPQTSKGSEQHYTRSNVRKRLPEHALCATFNFVTFFNDQNRTWWWRA